MGLQSRGRPTLLATARRVAAKHQHLFPDLNSQHLLLPALRDRLLLPRLRPGAGEARQVPAGPDLRRDQGVPDRPAGLQRAGRAHLCGPGPRVGLVFFITNVWTFLLRMSFVPPWACAMLMFISAAPTIATISSTLYITRASSSTLVSFPTCGIGWGAHTRTPVYSSTVGVGSEVWKSPEYGVLVLLYVIHDIGSGGACMYKCLGITPFLLANSTLLLHLIWYPLFLNLCE